MTARGVNARVPPAKDWSEMRRRIERMLVERTDRSLATWNRRVRAARLTSEAELRRWLKAQGVTGYPVMLLVWERFGYPGFLTATASQLLEGLFRRYPEQRTTYDRLIERTSDWKGVEVQARKTYVSLVGPKRTFARILPTSSGRLAVALRLDGAVAGGRLRPSRIHDSMPYQIELDSANALDGAAVRLLRQALQQAS